MKLQVTIKGAAPLIMHNGRLANPLDPATRKLKALTGKRNKTETDLEAIAEAEYAGGLYLGVGGVGPVIPSRLIESCIVEGARGSKEGKLALSGLFVDEDAVLVYDGPRDLAGLFSDDRFRLTVGVGVNSGSTVMRTRPIFRDWSATFTCSLDDAVADKDTLFKWITVAGARKGLGDWRPRHGRFVVTEYGEVTVTLAAAA